MVKIDARKVIAAFEKRKKKYTPLNIARAIRKFTHKNKHIKPKNWEDIYKRNVLDKRKDSEKFFPLTLQQKANVEYIKTLPQDKDPSHYLFCMYIPTFTNIAHKKTRPPAQQVAFRRFIASIYPTSRTYHPKGIIKCLLVKKKENGIPQDYPTLFINTTNYPRFVSIIYSAINNLTL